ncbi:unnamed protein product [Acidithrix sp. C25]|nr:unnamed protein product [Acidithrix sp. C25]
MPTTRHERFVGYRQIPLGSVNFAKIHLFGAPFELATWMASSQPSEIAFARKAVFIGVVVIIDDNLALGLLRI